MRSFQYVLVTVFFSLTWRTIDAVTNDEAKGDGNELKTVSSSVSSNKQMGIKQANLFGNRKLHGLFSRMFRLDLVMCDCDSDTSSAPSAMNSTAPSVVQSSAPSAVKSSAPSKSSEPSLKPSSKPSSKPSLTPSGKPSSEPSTAPSQNPSYKPSLKPSSKPSLALSNKPSMDPSGKPSTNPSLKPSFLPTLGPLVFTAKRLSISFMGCFCLRWKDDGTVITEDCDTSADDQYYEWDYDAGTGYFIPSAKANECLEKGDDNKPILATCSSDTMTGFEADGAQYSLFQDGDQYFSYTSSPVPTWIFAADGPNRSYFNIGCECSKCPG